MKILTAILFVFLAFAAKSQDKDLIEPLLMIKPLDHVQFSTKIDNSPVFPFQAETPDKYFLKANEDKSLNDLTAGITKSTVDNMLILNPGSTISPWNMPVAVCDSSVKYYMKKLIVPSNPAQKKR